MAIFDSSKSRKLLARKRLQKKISARRVLLETLESRQLLAVGPQLLGVQPNTGDLLESGDVLQVSPRELVFRFDDASGIDPNTLDGIRVVRSGEDGVFERASVATDLGTNGQTLVEFYAQETGEVGNGIEIRFSSVSRSDSRAPRVQVNGREINVELNSNPALLTRVEDLLQAFSPSVVTPATQLVYAQRLRGSQTIGIGQTADTSRPFVLAGANSAKTSTNFGIGNNVEVRLTARASGNDGLGISINVTSRDRGGAGNPIVSVNGKTINVELNSNARFPTTVREFIDAINSSQSLSSTLVEAQLVSGSGATRIGTLPTTYAPLTLTGVSDIEIVPAYVGLGDTDREVILRFGEALPDDRYRIEILGQGVRTLRNVEGEAFNEGVTRSVSFELDLGAQIESIVPQPVTRSANGALTQQRNQIDIFFNDDDLIDSSTIVSVNGISINDLRASRTPFFLQNTDTIVFAQGSSGVRGALDPNFYQLFHTADSLDNNDDLRFLPAAVRYYPEAARVTLTFNRNLDELQDPATGNPLPPAEFRLRVGTNESKPLPPVSVDGLTTDPADDFSNASDLNTNWTPGNGGSQSVLIDSEIKNTTPFLLDFPGGSDEPGNRNIRHQDNLRLGADSVDGTSLVYFNFQGNLGQGLSNSNQLNAITEQQKQRVREVLSLYEQYLGVRFVESSSLGLTIAVGDMRAILPFPEIVGSTAPGANELNAPGGTYYEAGTLRANGQLATVLDIQDFSQANRNEFGGPFQRAAMQAVGRLLGLGLADEIAPLTIQAFDSAFAPGVGTEIILPGDADIVHGQFLYRPDSKDIDLYQFSLPVDGTISIEAFAERLGSSSLLDSQLRLYQQNPTGGWDEIAANDDYYSSDSFLELDLQQGNYIVGVSASGNASYDPTISDTGIGGRSEGRYSLRLDFQPPAQRVLRDSTGTPIDGNLDGTPGGVHNFWFRPSGPANTKFVDKSASGTGNGSIATPFKNIDDALAAATPGDVVRIVGNGGADGAISTVGDNLAYEIGFDSLGRPLPDGSKFDVPRDVSVMIDAGAILKMRRSRVGVGSTSVSVDRSQGSLLVLGTPKLLTNTGEVITDSAGNPVAGSVYFTSANDGDVGVNANPAVVGSIPAQGDWGGLDFRNRIDASNPGRVNQEALGLFLNSINHADIRYGGGQVVVDGVSQVVTPVQLVDMRPNITFSSITQSSDAAISATPNSFLENNFHSPAEQGAFSFTTDYDRVGPDIHGNRLVNNSVNALQVRIRTSSSGTQLEKLTVPGRFDDTDIVHFIPENLQIQGTPGGAVLASETPSSTLVNLSTRDGGTLLSDGIYNYRFTTVDANGVERPATEPTQTLSLANVNFFGIGNARTIVLSNLPVGINRIYRSTATGSGPYELVSSFASSPDSFIDTGSSLGTILNEDLARFSSRLDARLAIDPGTIVKSQGARIDVDTGAQLLAEGTDGAPVVFTSLLDVRYGAGGTFDTANRDGAQAAFAGDWGGIYVGHTSKASLDYAVIAFGGGTTRVEGAFSNFNALEVHQGDLRLAHSRIESSGSGSESTTDTRGGRGTNVPAALFVRGSQPIIVDNVFINNLGPAISANVSALNYELVDDSGRSTGALDRFSNIVGNRGPLISANRLSNNEFNGLSVRGGSLTTEGWWDDTDIVHIVFDEIQVPDFHAYGGLKLVSKNDQSLVVKLDGDNSGFTATGTPLDNADRIGGSVQLLGQPNHPVILTSLSDSTVGAGFTLEGDVQSATLQSDGVNLLPTGPEVNNGTLIDNDVPVGIPGQFSFDVGPGGSSNFFGGLGGISAQGNTQLFSNLNVIFDYLNYVDVGADGNAIDLSTSTITLPPTLISPDLVASEGTFAGANGLVNWRVESRFDNGIAQMFNTIILSSATALGDLQVINYLDEDVQGVSDDILYSTGTPGQEDFRAFTLDGPERIGFGQGGIYTPTDGLLENATYEGWAADRFADLQIAIEGAGTTYTVDGNIDTNDLPPFNDAELGDVFGPADVTSAFTWRVDPNATEARITSFLELVPRNPASLASSGDWRGVLFDSNSNDRNSAATNEQESSSSTAAGTNNTTSNGQFLGSLAPDLKSGDENRRLGFQINAEIASPSDVDVYSFYADSGTEVWLDIDRTNNALDTVVELVDADGRTLALSDNSLAEEADPSLLYRATELADQSVNPLRKSSAEFYYTSATGAPKDLYSTNPKDAGLRIRLPGEAGGNNLYHVRVRSSSLQAGDPSSELLTPESVTGGLTKGSYQLQIRLTEVDEIPGSSINYADIRFASNGIELRGLPGNSPLLGENAEVEVRDINGDGVLDPVTESNDNFANAQALGNLLQTNRQAISVAGELDNITDVDWFSFDIDYQRITPTVLREYFATVIDMDYADGIGRPDTSMYVFDAAGNLILSSLASELVDDQASPVGGSGNADLSRGSTGGLDPFIGSYELPSATYFLAITNSNMVPEVLTTFTDPNTTSPGIRFEPIESIAKIAEDRVSGPSILFDPVESVVDFNLQDLTLYVTQDVGQELTNVYLVNPFTGELRSQVGRGGFDIQDIAFRPNGELRAFDRTIESQVGNADRDGFVDYINIDPGTGQFTATAAPIETSHIEIDANGNITVVDSNDGVNVEALTFASIGGQERGFLVGNRPTPPGELPAYRTSTAPLANVGTGRPGVTDFTNIIYEFDENTGQATSAPAADKTDNAVGFGTGTAIRERGYIETFTLDPATGAIVTQASQLVAVEATAGRANATPNLLIRDGQTFVVTDALGFQTVFEFNFGPEVLVNYDPASGLVVTDGMQFSLDGIVYEFEVDGGTVGVTPGAVSIPLAANASLRQFVDAIASNVVGVEVSFDAGRLNFSGATTGVFTDLANAGVFTDLGSSGSVAGGNVGVNLLASDTAETVAARVVQAVQLIGIPGLSATANGDRIFFSNGITVVSSDTLLPAGVAPGGIVTGIAVLGNRMFAVSDEGGLYVVNNPTALRSGNVAQYVAGSYELTGIEFTGLVAGPSHASNGTLSQLLFGIDSAGNIHAFDTNGTLQPVFANGASSISTGVSGSNGLALSTLDFNLWHTTTQRGGDAGHGILQSPNDSRGNVAGGSSFYFGYENAGANGVFDLTGPNSTGLQNSYDFPGGAAGALESRTFDLSGISAGDLPTLYFNYRFDTEGADSDLPRGQTADDYMRDSLRVYASGEDGQWILLATNNDPSLLGGGAGLADDELDGLVSGNPTVQPLFDNTDAWRQARVPMTLFAGQSNVKLRMEFSSAGGFGYGLNGGKGPEIRTIEGSRLSDGQSLVIEGQRFEIEMGPSLTLPSGAAISNGDSVTIEGNTYVFTDGTFAVSAPDIAVNYASAMTAEEVTTALLSAILAATPAQGTISGLSFTNETNDSLSRAESSQIVGDSVVMTGSGQIGDNPGVTDPGQDVDMVRIDVDRGGEVTVDVRAALIGSPLDTFVRVFDAEGNPLRDQFGQLIQNNNRPGSTDSQVTFVAPESGIYYIGVSGAGNQNYSPTVSGTATIGSTGNYELVVSVLRKFDPIASGNRIQLDGAKSVSVPASSPIVLQGALGSSGVPIYTTVAMDSSQIASALQDAVARFFAGGVTGSYPIRGGDTLELTGLSGFNLDSGPFGLTTSFVGDQFGAFNTGTNFDGTTSNARPGALGAQDNDFEGVYLDDFIIGIAGRGEQILGSTQPNTNFVVDPQQSVTNPDRGNPEILVGPYQFEIRGGEEYGTPSVTGFIQEAIFAPDSRLASGMSIRFNGASSMIAGSTFTVSDGTRVLTFEMDDVNDSVGVQPGNIALPFNTAVLDPTTGASRSESAQIIAARFRDILNSNTIQVDFDLTANLVNNDRSGATSNEVVLFGQPSVEIPASVGQKIVTQTNGATNRERPQGAIVINAARVSDSLGFGAIIDTGTRDPITNASQAGSPRNTVTINSERLVPGAVIMNSEFLFNNAGGISISGDIQQPGLPDAPVPFVKLVNNTIIGGSVSTIDDTTPSIEGNILFPQGAFSFADTVVDYSPRANGGPAPIAGLDDANEALGLPNYIGSGEPLPAEGVVSLGRGGQLTLQFTNNLLTGSGDANPDLVVFEVGDSEEVLVEISTDGNQFTPVGTASGSSPTIDIDAFGFNANSRLAFVRLTDIAIQGSQTGDSVGADIDAVGAISSVLVDNFAAGGEGITISNNATATVLNNVILNSTTGITVDASSASTVIGGTVFQRNTANTAGSATTGQFATVLDNSIPVFLGVGGGNLYPAPASPLIDSSIDSLEDRPSLVAVKAPLGLAPSPILAPQFDINGQLRVDDPAVETPSGLGENVFKDRGAQDRADFVGPSVVLSNPTDNDLAGLDRNPEASIVELSGVTPRFFDIRLLDGLEPSDPSRGSGIDHSSVNSSSVLVYRNDIPLVEGTDYRFGYDSTNGVIRLQPLAGIWASESVYTIRFLNSGESVVIATEAAQYTDGEQFQIIDASGSNTTFEFDLGYLVSVPSTNGIDPSITDGSTFILDDGARRVTFEMDTDGFFNPANTPVNLGASPSIESAGRAIQAAIVASGLSVTTTEVDAGELQIQGSRLTTLLPNNSGLTTTGTPGVQTVFGIQIPLESGVPTGLADGQVFTIDRSGSPVSFELDTNGTTLPGNIPVRYLVGSSAAQIGAALVTAIDGAALGLSPSYDGDGLVRLGGDVNTRLDMSGTALSQSGVAGLAASVAIALPADATATEVATLVRQAIDGQSLAGITTTQFGNRVVIEGGSGVGGEGAGQIRAIRDLAGNILKPNQVDGSTTLTIFLGEGFDYGDAPAPYTSTALANGPRHTVVNGLSLGATVTPDADAKLPDADLDDGFTVTSNIVPAFQGSVSIDVTNTIGQDAFVSLWIDYNQDGIFAQTERIVAAQRVTLASTNVSFLVPSSAMAGSTFARVRLSTDQAAVASPVGEARDGEVEDHQITISSNPYTNSLNNLDVSGDGFVSPIDVLQVINWLNDPARPSILSLADATGLPPFIDVNGNGTVTAIDALLVINELNARPPSGEGEFGISQLANEEFNGDSEIVLASDWAPSLENLVARSAERIARQSTTIYDLAMVDSDSEPSDADLDVGTSRSNSETMELFWAELAKSQETGEEADESDSLSIHDDLIEDLFA